MKVRSVKTNYILNIIRAASYALITIVTMPHINTTLGPTNVGKVEYVNTIITYFVLFSALGIPVYGIREIARVRNDKQLRDKTVVELLVILSFTTIISYLLLFGVLYQLDFFANYRDLLLLMSVTILLTNLGAEWYFQGIEDQLYITVRYVGVRIVSLILLFLLVKSEDDYLFYALTLVVTVCGSNIFNIYYLLKNINFRQVFEDKIDFRRHFKPVMTIFVAAVSVNIYLQLDNFLISTIAGDKYLGYYSVSNKLIRFIITFVTIVGMVMLPRLSNLYTADRNLYNEYLRKSFGMMMIMAIPSTISFLFFAPAIISLFAGAAFLPSVLTMQILSPLCIIVATAYFIGYLFLYTQNRENVYTRAVVFSALFSVSVNYFAIRHFHQDGAAVVSVFAELLAIVIMYFYARKDLHALHLFDKNLSKIVFIGLSCLLICSVISYTAAPQKPLTKIAVILLPYAIFYLLLYFSREKLTLELVNVARTKIRNLRS
ncbi:flippase [Kaistella rhinocerotis]|uniref:flippase n=1 Tax=Kaistella rhinocerotis TaxID=3026437 RepID=UPI002556DFEF|nr:flippase [Kaistella sp. Ran72]